MWVRWEGIEIDDQRARAAFDRQLRDGRHVYPTATIRLPTTDQDRHCWRLRINKLKNGIAIGAKSSKLEDGKVFGRDESIGYVWWLSNAGELNNGATRLAAGEPSPSDPREPPVRSPFRFKAGDVVEVLLDRWELTFTVNGRATTEKVDLIRPRSHTADDYFALSVQMLDRGDEVELLDSHPSAILEAELLKQCSSAMMMGRWQPKWFVLTSHTLMYRPGREWRAGKILELSGVKSVKSDGSTNIVVKHDTRTYHLRAPSVVGRNAWVQALEIAVRKRPFAGNSQKEQSWKARPGGKRQHAPRRDSGGEGAHSSGGCEEPGDEDWGRGFTNQEGRPVPDAHHHHHHHHDGGESDASEEGEARTGAASPPRSSHSLPPNLKLGARLEESPKAVPAVRPGSAAEGAWQSYALRDGGDARRRDTPAAGARAGEETGAGGAGGAARAAETKKGRGPRERGGSSPGVRIPRLESVDLGMRPASCEPDSTVAMAGGVKMAWSSFTSRASEPERAGPESQ